MLQTSVSLPATEEAEVDFDEIELGPRIGIGCFGEVFKARWRQTTVAVKRLFAQSVSEKSIEVYLHKSNRPKDMSKYRRAHCARLAYRSSRLRC